VIKLGEIVMILELHRQGVSVSAIARQLGIDRTVRKHIASGLAAPSYKARPPRERAITTFEPYLRERLAAFPALSGRRLWRKIKDRGYAGGYTAVTSCANFRRRARKASRCASRRRPANRRKFTSPASMSSSSTSPAPSGSYGSSPWSWAVPGQEPPIAVGAIDRMDERVAILVQRVFGRPLEHLAHRLLVTRERACLYLGGRVRVGQIPSSPLRGGLRSRAVSCNREEPSVVATDASRSRRERLESEMSNFGMRFSSLAM
jgi:hypothetical protein